jgi:tungstate transport system substrate-binding protein
LRTFLFLLVFLFLSTAILAQEKILILATTTSVENSGLLSYLLPIFEKKTGIKVKVVARGTGAAIEMGKRGDADVVFVHAKELELKAVKEGWFVNRKEVCYNDFIIVGPKNDPARVKNSKDVITAFKKISQAKALFISRGDNSGTHIKELKIWKLAGINPKGKPWYLEAGQGMEKTLFMANEKDAYTLTDRGTWLAVRSRLKYLALLFEGAPLLFNQYSVMAVNPKKHPHVNYEDALKFINWITSHEGQRLIGNFKDKFGNQLFIPNAK